MVLSLKDIYQYGFVELAEPDPLICSSQTSRLALEQNTMTH